MGNPREIVEEIEGSCGRKKEEESSERGVDFPLFMCYMIRMESGMVLESLTRRSDMDIKAIIDGIETPEIAKGRRVEGDAVIFDMGAYDLKVIIEEDDHFGYDSLTDSLGASTKRIVRTLFMMVNSNVVPQGCSFRADLMIHEEIKRMHDVLSGCADKNIELAQAA